ILAGQASVARAEPGARVAERGPVHVEHALGADDPFLDGDLDEEVLDAAGAAVQARAVAAGGRRLHGDAERAVAEPPEEVEEPVAVERVLHSLGGVVIEQAAGLHAGRPAQLRLEVLEVEVEPAELPGLELAEDAGEAQLQRVDAPAQRLAAAAGEGEP